MFVSILTGPDPLTASDGYCKRYQKVSSLVLGGQSIAPFTVNSGAEDRLEGLFSSQSNIAG